MSEPVTAPTTTDLRDQLEQIVDLTRGTPGFYEARRRVDALLAGPLAAHVRVHELREQWEHASDEVLHGTPSGHLLTLLGEALDGTR